MKRKLQVRRETLKTLIGGELELVVGGTGPALGSSVCGQGPALGSSVCSQ